MPNTVYSKDHEYVRSENGAATIGISNFAQEQLGDIVYVELPEVGAHFDKGDEIAVVESVKAASEIYAPLGFTVTAVNQALNANPGLINTDAMGEGWLIKATLDEPDATAGLMDEAAYTAHTA